MYDWIIFIIVSLTILCNVLHIRENKHLSSTYDHNFPYYFYKTVQNEVLDSKPIDSSGSRNFFISRWLLKSLNYAKSNKKRTSYIDTHTHTHTCKVLQFSYFEIIVWYSHHRCYKLYLFQNFSSIKFFLEVFILFVRA